MCYLRTVWQQKCGRPLKWGGGKQRKIDVLDVCIRIVDKDKNFFKNLYEHAHVRHEYVRDNGGDLYTNSLLFCLICVRAFIFAQISAFLCSIFRTILHLLVKK